MIGEFPPVRILLLFFGYVARSVEDQFPGLKHDLRGARLATTYHGYLARTLLYALLAFVAVLFGLVGPTVLLAGDALSVTDQGVLLVGLVVPATLASYLVYRGRLYYPRYLAGERARRIELTLPNVTNFLLALSRAGVSTRETLRVIAANADVLGTAADEFRYAYRDMEYFGADVVTGLDHLSETTFLDDLSDFVDGYLRALTGRGDVLEYLEDEMEDLYERAEIQQEEFLSSLGVLAEVYVAVFVAGPIFALIILVVMGFIGSPDVLTGIGLIVYVVIPLAAVGYLLLLDVYISAPLEGGSSQHRRLETADRYERDAGSIPRAEGGDPEEIEANIEALDRFRSRRSLRRFLRAPLVALRRRPRYALYAGLGLAVLYAAVKLALGVAAPDLPLVPAVPAAMDAPDALARTVDATIVEAAILALLVFTAFYELRARYLSAVERALPGFLSELGDRHGIGMALSDSISALADRDMGRLDPEIRRMRRDFRLGATADDALRRFANRIRSPVVTRVVVLLAAAADTADRLGPVIEALARRAELTHRLRRERAIEMSLYVVIIYIAYAVFLLILVVLHDVFIPQLPSGDITASTFQLGGSFDAEAYRMIFFHMAVLQGVLSGLVGGKMSDGTAAAGAKHALVMVVLAYFVFVVFLPAVTIQL